MNLQQLQYALEVQKTGSISQAANNLYMNQPNLSKSIKELEESLGVLIFHRTPQGVSPTTKGTEILLRAREIVQKADELVRFCKDGDQLSLSVAAPPASYISSAFVAIVNRSLGDSTSFSSKYAEQNSDAVQHLVLSGEYALGIVRFPETAYPAVIQQMEQLRLDFIPLFSFTPRLIFSTANPLVLAKELTPALLQNQTEITVSPEGNCLSPEIPMPEDTPSLQAVDRTNQYQMLQEIPHTYLWGSPVPRKILEQHNLYQRETALQSSVFCDIAVFLSGRTLSELELAFIKEVQKLAATLV